MTTLGLTQQDEYKLLTGVESRYTDYSQIGPGMVEPSDILEPFRGAGRGLAKASGLVNEAAYPIVGVYTKMLDDMLGTDLTGFSYDTFVLGSRRLSQRLAPDPTTSGYVGQALNSLFDVGSSFTAGFAVGGPAGGAAVAGASTAYNSINEGREKGLDPTTNVGKAAIEGFSVALGARLPASIGGSVGKNMLMYGPGINVLQGVASRGLVSDWLRARGFDELADQYHAFDMQSIAVDAILGGLFGGLGARGTHPDHVDAALVAHENAHLELDTAPGVPKDPASRNAHTAAVVKATEDLLSGQPVKVEEVVRSAEFTEHPQSSKMTEVIVKALNDAGFGQVAKDIDKLKADLDARGLKTPEFDNDLTSPLASEAKALGKEPKKSPEKAKSKALTVAQENNTYRYVESDGSMGYGRNIGFPQPEGTPVEKLFSNFADNLKPEQIAEFRQKILERAMGHSQPPYKLAEIYTDTVKGFRKGYSLSITANPYKADAIGQMSGGKTLVTITRGGETVAAAGIRRGMIDSLAVSEKFKGKNIGADLLVWLQKNGIANIYEVPDRSPGFVKAQKKAIETLSGSVKPQETPSKLPESRLNEVPAEAPDGTQVTAAKAMEDVEAAIKKAENDSKAFDAAVKCFLGIE